MLVGCTQVPDKPTQVLLLNFVPQDDEDTERQHGRSGSANDHDRCHIRYLPQLPAKSGLVVTTAARMAVGTITVEASELSVPLYRPQLPAPGAEPKEDLQTTSHM